MWRSATVLIGLVLLSGCAADIQAQAPTHVLVVNDDGISSPGLAAVAAVIAADPSYRVTVVAPAEQQSGVGHAIVIRREIAIRPHDEVGGAPAWSVDATPASVTAVGLTVVLENDPPDLVVSQITSTRINDEMRVRGIDVIELPYSEPPKTGGSFRCCTLPLHRAH